MASAKLYKDEADLLQAQLEDKTHHHNKEMSALTIRVKKETHQANTYLKHIETVFLEVMRITQDLKCKHEDPKLSPTKGSKAFASYYQ